MGEFHAAMTKRKISLFVLAIFLAAIAFGAQQRNTGGTTQTSPFNEQRAAQDLTTIVGFGPRPAGSEALARTRNYIVGELQKAGLKAQLDEFDARTPRGVKRMV